MLQTKYLSSHIYIQVCNQREIRRITFEEVSEQLNYEIVIAIVGVYINITLPYLYRNTSMKAFVKMSPRQKNFSFILKRLSNLMFHIQPQTLQPKIATIQLMH